jgi:hypothetical protein
LLRKSSKKLALVLVLTMLATMFVGVGAASAATTYSVVSAPTVAKGTNDDLGTVLINIDVLQGRTSASSFLVTLPQDFVFPGNVGDTWNALTVSRNDDETAGANAWYRGKVVGVAEKLNDREIRVDVIPVTDDGLSGGTPVDYDDVRLALALASIDIPADADQGAVEAIITAISGQFPSGTVTVANIPGGEVTLSVLDKITLELGGTETIQITVKEDSQAGLEEGNKTLRFRLPKGFEWAADGTVTNIGATGVDTLTATVDGSDARYLNINRSGTTDAKAVYRVSADIRVSDDDDAKLGDIVVAVSGSSNYSPSTLTIGTYADYGYTITVEESDKIILAGRVDEDAEISSFRIKEAIGHTLIDNRTVIMELPDGVYWDDTNEDGTGTALIDTTNKSGNLNFGSPYLYSNARNKVRLTVSNSGSSKGDVEIEAKVRVAVNYTGPITIKFSGSAGINDEITVGEVIAPITAACNSVNVIIGAQDQPGADIVITESQGEALISGQDLVLTAPDGVSFSKLPTVEAEDLSIGTVTRASNDGTRNNKLFIPIRSQSDNGGTITISDLYYTVDRTVAEGAMKITIGGDAVDQAGITNRTVAATVVAAQNVTSAGASEIYSGTFVIGSTTYTLNGVEYTMDVAPFISGDRTFMPIRYVAYALGISEANIMWDGSANSVTLIKGDKVVQLTVGSTAMLINGATVNMDVAPVNVAPGRVCLPIRFVAQAFGAEVGWDAETQTVSIN